MEPLSRAGAGVTGPGEKHLEPGSCGGSSQRTHRTSSPRRRGWSSSCHMEGRWRGPPGSSARCPGSTRPRRPRQWPCPRCPRPAHLLGYRWRSTRWTQWWRLPLGPTPSPKIKRVCGKDLGSKDTGSCKAVFIGFEFFNTVIQMTISNQRWLEKQYLCCDSIRLFATECLRNKS